MNLKLVGGCFMNVRTSECYKESEYLIYFENTEGICECDLNHDWCNVLLFV